MVSRRVDYFPAELEPEGRIEAVECGFPGRRRTLSAAALGGLAAGLRSRAAEIRAVPATRVIRGLAETHAEWAREGSPIRALAVERLRATTGYAEPALDRSLQRLFAGMDAPELERWLRLAGIEPGELDPPSGTGMPRAMTFGPELTLIVASGNIPGAALPSVVHALLLKSPCLVKSPSAEPALLPLYARTLERSAPELARVLAVTGWAGGDEALEAAVLDAAEAVVVYGSDAAVRSLRGRTPPRVRFLGYGHRISVSAVGRECLEPERLPDLAARIAEDAATFDQQGCLSPQAVYVEAGGAVSPEMLGAAVAEALEVLRHRLHRRPLSPDEAAAIHQYRAIAEMRALVEPGVRTWASAGDTSWTVVLDPVATLQPCCLNRTVVLHPVESLDSLPELLAPHRAALLSVGLEVSSERQAALAWHLAAAGATRFTRVGMAQDPATTLYHDGVDAVAALARRVVTEAGSS